MRTLLCLCFVMAFVACSKDQDETTTPSKSCPILCANIPVHVVFPSNNYSLEEIDTVILKRYAADGTFTTLVSETMLNLNDTLTYYNYTITHLKYMFNGCELYNGADYEIVIPGTSQVYKIWDIKDPHQIQDYGCDPKHNSCLATINKFSISGGNAVQLYDRQGNANVYYLGLLQ